MQEIITQILKKLNDKGIPFEHISHEPVITSQDAAKIRDTDISMGAKALIFLADKKPVLVVVPGDKKLDLKKFKSLYHIKDMSMANKEQLFDITGLSKGAVPPIGSLFSIDSYFAKDFENKDKIAFNAGSHTDSICMMASDLLRLEEPIIGDFSK